MLVNTEHSNNISQIYLILSNSERPIVLHKSRDINVLYCTIWICSVTSVA